MLRNCGFFFLAYVRNYVKSSTDISALQWNLFIGFNNNLINYTWKRINYIIYG